MEIIGVTYQFNMFIKNLDLKPSSESIVKLMPLVKAGFMPSVVDEFNEVGDKNKALKTEKEIDGRVISITFGNQGIIIQVSSDKTINPKDLMSDFDLAIKQLTMLEEEYIGYRISCIINIIAKTTPELENKIYPKFFKDNDEYFEWSVRRAKKDTCEKENTFNVISVNKGLAIKQSPTAISNIEAIIIVIDNNTSTEDQSPRFSHKKYNIFKNLYEKSSCALEELLR